MDIPRTGTNGMTPRYIVAIEQVQPTYGAARVALDLASGLAERRDVTLLRLRGSNGDLPKASDSKVQQVILQSVKTGLIGKLRQVLALRQYLKDQAIQGPIVVVSLLTTTNLLLCGAVAGLSDVKLVVTEHNVQTEALANYGAKKRSVLLLLMRCAYRYVQVVAVSEAVAFDLVDNIKVPLYRTKVIYNPIDVARILNQALAETEVLVSGDYNLACIAELKPAKQQHILINMMAHLENVNLYLIGGGPSEGELRKHVDKLDLKSRVHFVGRQENPWPLVKQMNATILTPKFEGFGLVAAESAAVGVKPIGLAVGGLAEALTFTGGLSVDPGQDISSKLADIVRADQTSAGSTFVVPKEWLQSRSPGRVASEYIALAEAL